MMENVNKLFRRKSKKSGEVSLLSAIISDRLAFAGLIIVGVFFGWAILQGSLEILSTYLRYPRLSYILLPHDPFAFTDNIASGLVLHPPSTTYLFGTNADGEDILSRILYAMPKDAFVSVFVVFSAIFFGAILGITAGFRGRYFNEVIMRLTDAFLSLPALILVIAISVPLKGGFDAVLISLSLVWWPTYTRFFRAETLRIKNLDFIVASKLSKISRMKFFYKYLFKNSVDPIIAYAALDFGNVILTYSTLAFLGIGIQVKYPELGEMASKGLGYLPQAWWYSVFPGLVILLIVIGFVLLGDRLQDIVSNRENR